jgi:serine/threonine-protein kinase
LAALVDECLFKAPGSRPSPQNLSARLERAASAPPSSGAARLQEAYRAEARREAERTREASKASTEQERRDELAASAARSFQFIGRELYDAVTQSAPGAARLGPAAGPWTVSLGGARLSWNEPRPSRGFGQPGAPTFDLIAFASISLTTPKNPYGYKGRNHSLYFCDAQQAGEYAWFETAFMSSAFSGAVAATSPFSLDPGDAAEALGRGMALRQAAWPFTRLVHSECEEFIDRWLDWFARASQGQLGLPGHMPERPTTGTWRMD